MSLYVWRKTSYEAAGRLKPREDKKNQLTLEGYEIARVHNDAGWDTKNPGRRQVHMCEIAVDGPRVRVHIPLVQQAK